MCSLKVSFSSIIIPSNVSDADAERVILSNTRDSNLVLDLFPRDIKWHFSGLSTIKFSWNQFVNCLKFLLKICLILTTFLSIAYKELSSA